MKIMIPLLSIIFFSAQGRALVNLKNASFEKTWITHFLERTYNSKSLYSGILGYGWCSNLEYRIEFKSEKLNLYKCEQLVEYKILKRIKNEIYLEISKNRSLVFNKNNMFRALIEKNKTLYEIRYSNDNKIQSIMDINNDLWAVNWSKNIITSIVSKKDRILFDHDEDNLISVALADNQKWLYLYDNLNNLTEYKNKKEKVLINYDSDKDQISKIIEPNGCEEHFLFEEQIKSNSIVQKSNAIRRCTDRIIKNVSVEFSYSKNMDGTYSMINAIKTDKK